MRTATVALALGLMLHTCACAQETRTISVYHIGNSLTRSLTLDRVHLLFAERGIDYQFSTQLAGGCTLKRHWEAREKGMQTRQWETNKRVGDRWEPGGPDWDPNPKRFGPYWEALSQHTWDAVVLQPYRSHLRDDLPAIRSFINYALERGATRRFYLYQTWPNRPATNPKEQDRAKRVYADIDYQALWEREYPFDEDSAEVSGDAFQSRDYFARLLARVNAEFAGRLDGPVRMVPVGEVWYELDRRIKAGGIPGLTELYARDNALVPGWKPETGIPAGANILYADGIHPNPIPHLTGNLANYVNGLTMFAVIGEQSPVGMTGAIYGLDDAKDKALIEAVQEVVWEVVRREAGTGLPSRPAAAR